MDITSYLYVLVALAFVLGLIGIMTLAARRLGLAQRMGTPGGNRRLSIVATLPLDSKRRAVLLRRDGVEHLVLLSATSETVVESGIPALEGDFPATLQQTMSSPPEGAEEAHPT
jgi:flagellar protein FliO/FliZ